MKKLSSILTLQAYTVSVLHKETSRYWSHAVSQKQCIYLENTADYKIAIQINLQYYYNIFTYTFTNVNTLFYFIKQTSNKNIRGIC